MSFRTRHTLPDLGVGVGFRAPHREAVFAWLAGEHPAAARWDEQVAWFEVISENYLGDGGRPLHTLDQLRARFPVIPHGVSLNLGGPDRLNRDHLQRLRRLVERLDAPWFSDHLCFTGAGGVEVHDLLPLPCTEKVADWVADRIRAVSDAIGRPFLLENPSSYVTWRSDTMPEWEFLSRIADRADCGLLFDVNNVFVAATNHGFDAHAYIDGIDPDRVGQIHLAGHSERGPARTDPSLAPGKYLFDTHSTAVCDDVWDLYRRTIARTGPVTTLIEWDEEIPAFEVLADEAEKAKNARALGAQIAVGEKSV